MPAALQVDWSEVKTLALAIGVREAARQMGLKESAVMQRCAREGWLAERHEAKAALSPAGRAATLAAAHGVSVVSNPVTTAAEVLARMGEDTRAGFATAAMKVARRSAQMDEDELMLSGQQVRPWQQIAASVHGWDKDTRGGGAGAVSVVLVLPSGEACRPIEGVERESVSITDI